MTPVRVTGMEVAPPPAPDESGNDERNRDALVAQNRRVENSRPDEIGKG